MHEELTSLERQIFSARPCPESSEQLRRDILQRTAQAYQRHARQRQFAAASAALVLAIGLLITLPSLAPPAFASTGSAAAATDDSAVPLYGVEDLRTMEVSGDEWRLVDASVQIRRRHSRLLRNALRSGDDDAS